jgi:hypothetical protein
MIIPSLLINITCTESVPPKKRSQNNGIRRMSIQDQLITEGELQSIATHSLALLCTSCSITTLKVMMGVFFGLSSSYEGS